MVNTGVLSPEDVRKGQEKIKEEIYARAKELGISKAGPQPPILRKRCGRQIGKTEYM